MLRHLLAIFLLCAIPSVARAQALPALGVEPFTAEPIEPAPFGLESEETSGDLSYQLELDSEPLFHEPLLPDAMLPADVAIGIEEAEAPRPLKRRGGGGGPMGGPPGYDATWYPTQAVSGQNADMGFVRQGMTIAAPVWGDFKSGRVVLASVGVRNTLFSTDAILPDSLTAFPEKLWNVNFGLNYMHQFDNGWSGGLMSGFGSASDEPFHSIDEFTANLGGFVKVPASNGRDSWQYMLMYMYGGPVNFPLPMISYSWNPNDELRVNIGLPLSVEWQPTEQLTFNLSYFPLYNINARATYAFTPTFAVFGGYEYLNESYFLADRVDTEDRFFVLEQRLITGLRWDVGKRGQLQLLGGYSFGRKFGQGDSQWDTLFDQVNVDPGPFVGAKFQLMF
jgi:hypothetical protein